MVRKRNTRFRLLLAATGVAAASFVATAPVRWLRVFSGGPALGTQPAKRALSWLPFQIRYKWYASRPGEEHPVLAADSVRAVRADGSEAEAITWYRLDGSIELQTRTLDLPGGVNIKADVRLQTMTVTRNPAAEYARARHALDPAKSCAASVDGSNMGRDVTVVQDTLMGYKTYRITVFMKPYRRTMWRAPALGCADLRELGERIDLESGTVMAISDRVAVEIRHGDPDPALFEPPRGYLEVSRSEVPIWPHGRRSRMATNSGSDSASTALGM